MKHPNKKNFDTSPIIRSSEIGQYLYCSMAWYLQRCGYQPQSKQLDEGTQKHISYGDSIDTIHHQKKRFSSYALLSIIFFVLALILIVLEVVR